jgi:hypothetical protein
MSCILQETEKSLSENNKEKMEEEVMSEAGKVYEDLKRLGDVFADALNRVENNKDNTIKESMDDIRAVLEEEIQKSCTEEESKEDMLERLKQFCETKANIMLVGATGCGKSSTINALFACNSEDGAAHAVAKVGSKADPETRDIDKYTIGNLTLWDTPGLGDGTEIDRHHREVITELLNEEDEDGNALIDIVLVILDGSSKDLGTTYKILNDVIIPALGDETDRILVALNQADIAMKTGRHWDYEKNEPDETLVEFLEEKVKSIKERILEDSGLEVSPVYYCAGYEEESGDTVRPYNLSKLLYYILQAMPAEKRIVVMESINEDADYNEGVKDSFFESLNANLDFCFSDGIAKGAVIGSDILGIPGLVVGSVVGGVVGGISGILSRIFG